MKPDSARIQLQTCFDHNGGYAWRASIEIEGDGLDVSNYYSDLMLFENDTPLGPARSAHAQIREKGLGRFSHWGQNIYFAASDNTDPNTNGRIYIAKVTPRDAGKDRANYGIAMARRYINWLGLWKSGLNALPFKGAKVFELGPGLSMSTAMAITAFGGTVYVKERQQIQWNEKLHGCTAEKMLDVFEKSGDEFDPKPLQRCLELGAFDPERIIVLNQDNSTVGDMLADTIDHTVSAAVLEHVSALRDELSFLHAISKKNSSGVHFVDFTDHHNTEEPLEFLALGDDDFLSSCEYRFSRGSRMRYQHLQQIAELVGFQADEVFRCEIDSSYLNEFTPRLRKSSSRFKDLPTDWLRTLLSVVRLDKI